MRYDGCYVRRKTFVKIFVRRDEITEAKGDKNMVSEIAKDFFYFQITYIIFVWIFGTGSRKKRIESKKGNLH